jgi:hypothetical protein
MRQECPWIYNFILNSLLLSVRKDGFDDLKLAAAENGGRICKYSKFPPK